jgi:hypothetical protein
MLSQPPCLRKLKHGLASAEETTWIASAKTEVEALEYRPKPLWIIGSENISP